MRGPGLELTIVDGSEQVYEQGAVFEVPPGTRHQMMAAEGGQAGENFLDEFAAEIRFG